jgi:peptidoglycan/LPS O-acetylase OafA/YrhL
LLELDVLRGVAVLLVILEHSCIPLAKTGALEPVAHFFYLFGWTGVDLFFVLSGFLVGGLLMKEIRDRHTLDVKRFLIRRCCKIWPAYFVYLAWFFLFMTRIRSMERASFGQAFFQLLPNFIHLQNYLGSPRGHTWSLAVEEHFYLLLPLFLLWMSRQPRASYGKLIGTVTLSLMIACTALRLWWAHGGYHWPQNLTYTHLRLDSLFMGVFIAYWYYFHPAALCRLKLHRKTVFLLGLAMLSPMMMVHVVDSSWVGTYGFVLLYIGYGVIMLSVLPFGDEPGPLSGTNNPILTAIAFVGFFSYPIYLWHFDVNEILMQYMLSRGFLVALPAGARWLLATIVYGGLSIAIGTGVSLVLEKPVLTLRDRLFPSALRTSPPLPPAAVAVLAEERPLALAHAEV